MICRATTSGGRRWSKHVAFFFANAKKSQPGSELPKPSPKVTLLLMVVLFRGCHFMLENPLGSIVSDLHWKTATMLFTILGQISDFGSAFMILIPLRLSSVSVFVPSLLHIPFMKCILRLECLVPQQESQQSFSAMTPSWCTYTGQFGLARHRCMLHARKIYSISTKKCCKYPWCVYLLPLPLQEIWSKLAPASSRRTRGANYCSISKCCRHMEISGRARSEGDPGLPSSLWTKCYLTSLNTH